MDHLVCQFWRHLSRPFSAFWRPMLKASKSLPSSVILQLAEPAASHTMPWTTVLLSYKLMNQTIRFKIPTTIGISHPQTDNPQIDQTGKHSPQQVCLYSSVQYRFNAGSTPVSLIDYCCSNCAGFLAQFWSRISQCSTSERLLKIVYHQEIALHHLVGPLRYMDFWH